ncbi:MAG: hypothetical protein Ct9H300mP13_0830 [Gammaproteobacteria bacterium]|nr:MAG: hypothetical protein Ct9H300mP13_0830 [Gammaproteobacteria bacterium]
MPKPYVHRHLLAKAVARRERMSGLVTNCSWHGTPARRFEWQEYAFRRSTEANPFLAMMGRVCPAPCEAGFNRNQVDDFVGINAVEQFIGDTAFQQWYRFEGKPPELLGEKSGDRRGGPAGLSAAYQLRRRVMPRRCLRCRISWAVCFVTAFQGFRTQETFWTERLSE